MSGSAELVRGGGRMRCMSEQIEAAQHVPEFVAAILTKCCQGNQEPSLL